MAGEIDDALLDALVPRAPYATLGERLAALYGGVARRLCLPLPDDPTDDPHAARLVARLRGA
jgi:hypothetical protein